ncbi:MAG: hypothetical protein DWC00_05920 [Candidatus Poseidoniales archaeon]|nr:MAG: hypothetical protein DWC00_05920 [Candidatus Poseidoniales archaeon]
MYRILFSSCKSLTTLDVEEERSRFQLEEVESNEYKSPPVFAA